MTAAGAFAAVAKSAELKPKQVKSVITSYVELATSELKKKHGSFKFGGVLNEKNGSFKFGAVLNMKLKAQEDAPTGDGSLLVPCPYRMKLKAPN